MTKTKLLFIVALLACLLALPVAAKDIARVSVDPGEVIFMPEIAAAGFQLTVTGPGGYLFQAEFDASSPMSWTAVNLDGSPLANGAYQYELRVVKSPAKRNAATELEGAKRGAAALSGTVTVRGGSLVDPQVPEKPLTKDQVINDDLIVDGSICAGLDCVNGESFGFDTLRLKENNVRIKFDDTSNSASFPNFDWQLTANESANGGLNKFSIDDITSGRTPFTIEGSADANSLYVDTGGRIGFGTNSPVVELHVKDGDTPTLRLEQDGSSGFTAQTWDVAGNETNYFVRDATNGSTLPFRIRPGAPTSAIDIAASGNVGIGTSAPQGKLHIENTGGQNTDDFIVLTNGRVGIATEAPGQELEVASNDAGNSAIRISTASHQWDFSTNEATGQFRIAKVGPGITQFTLDSTGNLTLTGSLITGGSGTCAPPNPACDGVFHPDYELESIEEHASSMWEKSYLPAVGPTLPNVPINLTLKTTGILNELEKAHIYIEQLHSTVKQLEARLLKLEGSGD